MEIAEKIPNNLQSYIKENSIISASPGRINLIGEHTDYNNGFVLPAAIDKYAYIVLTPREDDKIILNSLDFDDSYSTETDTLKKCDTTLWPNYLLGVAKEFKDRNIQLKGFEATLTGQVPAGSGLSSSAAIECAMAFALNDYLQANIERIELTKMSQSAENNFVGMNCGIMDQFASMFGKNDSLIQLDCRDLSYKYIPFKLDHFSVLLLDTNVKHSLASSEYNTRRKECEEGVAKIKTNYPEVESLRDATMEMLNNSIEDNTSAAYRRCKYVIGEIQRLQDACEDLMHDDLKAFGQKMFITHEGLSKDYEVSCEELDYFVEFVKNNPDVLGARMMGGGFGGCTINIVENKAIQPLVDSLTKAYHEKYGKELKYYIANISQGAHIIAD